MRIDKALQNLDCEDGWPPIETRLNTILANPAANKIDMPTLMSTYTAIYDLCHELVSRVSHLAVREVYRRLKIYLTKHLDSVCAKVNGDSSEALLAFYVEEWKRYTTATNILAMCLIMWTDTCERRGRRERKPCDTYTLQFVLWKEVMFDSTQNRVLGAVLHLARMQRNGETVELSLAKEVIDSFVSLGFDAEDSGGTSLGIYPLLLRAPIPKSHREILQHRVETSPGLGENA